MSGVRESKNGHGSANPSSNQDPKTTDEAVHNDSAFHPEPRDKTQIPDYVREQEAHSINARRGAAFSRDEEQEIDDAVGVALSGGGIRSASFNLGLLQALIRTGITRWIDYMSTVSGGGFIGSYLSTTLCHEEFEKYNHNLHLVPRAGGDQPEPDKRFIQGGTYLKSGPEMSDRFLIGFLCNGLLWLTLLMTVTAFLAWSWRWLDNPRWTLWLRDQNGLLGWIGTYARDWTRPFAPALLFTLLWLLGWIVIRFCSVFGICRFVARFLNAHCKYLPLLILSSLVIGFAVLLATDDISLEKFGHTESARVNGHSIIGKIAIVIVIISLIVALNPLRLARSELRPPTKAEIAATRITGSILLFLVPFCLLYAFAREGISQGQPDSTSARSALAAADLGEPFEFLERCYREKGRQTLGARLSGELESRIIGPKKIRFGITPAHQEITRGIPTYFDGVPLDEPGELNKRLAGKTLLESVLDKEGLFARPEFCNELIALGTQPSFESLLALGRRLEDKSIPESLRTQARLIVACHLAAILNDILMPQGSQPAAEIPYRFARSRYERAVRQQGRVIAGESLAAADPFFKNASKLREADLFLNWLWPQALLAEGSLGKTDRDSFNRFVLEANFGDALVEQRTKCGVTLNWAEDQSLRFRLFILSLVSFLILGLLIDFNSTSLHEFYRKKIQAAYVVKGTKGELLQALDTTKKGGPYHIICATINFIDDLPWRTTELTSAYTFLFSKDFCGSQALRAPGKVVDKRMKDLVEGKKPKDPEKTEQDPEKTEQVPLYAETKKYCGGKLSVATAAAISGAAFSPATLRHPLYSIIMLVLNFRLGQWLPNPTVPDGQVKSRRVSLLIILRDLWLTRVGIWRCFIKTENLYQYKRVREKLFGMDLPERVQFYKLKPEHWRYCFITDGGHNDNLGISPLVFRRCRLMIFSDATRDEQYRFQDFLKIFRRYRMRGGMHFCRLESWRDWLGEPTEKLERELLDLSPLRAREVGDSASLKTVGKTNQSQIGEEQEEHVRVRTAKTVPDRSDRHIVLSKLIYPEKDKYALAVYLKSTMTGDEPQDLLQYQADNPQFPHDPTTDQFFTEDQVESYRQLGEHIGLELCRKILEGMRLRGHAVGQSDFELEEPLAWASALNELDSEELVRCLLTGYFGPPDPDSLKILDRDFSILKSEFPIEIVRSAFRDAVTQPDRLSELLQIGRDRLRDATQNRAPDPATTRTEPKTGGGELTDPEIESGTEPISAPVIEPKTKACPLAEIGLDTEPSMSPEKEIGPGPKCENDTEPRPHSEVEPSIEPGISPDGEPRVTMRAETDPETLAETSPPSKAEHERLERLEKCCQALEWVGNRLHDLMEKDPIRAQAFSDLQTPLEEIQKLLNRNANVSNAVQKAEGAIKAALSQLEPSIPEAEVETHQQELEPSSESKAKAAEIAQAKGEDGGPDI